MSSNTRQAATLLVEQWKDQLDKYHQQQSQPSIKTLLPTPLQMYHLGLTLYASKSTTSILVPYKDLLSSLPDFYRRDVFGDLKDALLELIGSNAPTISDVQQGLQSMIGLYMVEEAVRYCAWTLDHVSQIVLQYTRHNGDDEMRLTTVCFVSPIFWSFASKVEETMFFINLLQESALWNTFIQYHDSTDTEWRSKLLQTFSDSDMLDYVQSMLKVEQEVSLKFVKVDTKAPTKASITSISPAEDLQRRIDQVREIIPSVGEGFVEAALSYYHGNVEEATSALLDPDNLPAQLQIVDKQLPCRRREQESMELDEASRRVAKAALEAMEAKQVQEAMYIERVTLNDPLYDDDYDDTYDEIVDTGNADSGLYDDYDAIMTYNRAVKQIVNEQSFWEDSRNSNRNQNGLTPKYSINEDGERVYRGPDKGRGGRIPFSGRSADSTGRGAGGRGRGRGGPKKEEETKDDKNNNNNAEEASKKPTKSSERYKDKKLANRREKQKQAIAKRVG
jgi:hypothetical protein